jgi:branched-chain amino acid transport system ATP-binding protein
MLKINKINVSYGKLQVLWDVSFEVNKGDITAIIGPNGAGKTTILRTIAGLLKPLSGSITFMNEKIDGIPPNKIVKRGISLVMEGRKLFPKMTVLENLEMGAYTKWDERFDMLEKIFQIFPILKERKNQLAGTLSGGEQQMLAIARALMSRPKLLMLDEPSLGLAPKLVLQIFDLVKEINDNGVTILLVEQNVKHALELASRAYVLENGRIVLEGKGNELLENEYVKKAYLGI